MAAAVTFELRGWGIPAVGFGIPLGGHAIGVAVVVQLLAHVQRQQLVYVEVAVVRQAVSAVDSNLVQGQRLGNGACRRCGIAAANYFHMSFHRKSQRGRVVAYDISLNVIALAYLVVHQFLLNSRRCRLPAHLSVFLCTVGICYP